MLKNALLLGAGGPLGPLEAGAIIALDEEGVNFDIISGACIGSVLALSYACPANGMTGRQAIEKWCENACVSDFIYNYFPVNYKIFLKDQGILSSYFDYFRKLMLKFSFFVNLNPKNEFQRYLSDLSFLFTDVFFMPSFTNYFSEALTRFSKDDFKLFIDFEKLKTLNEKEVYINALNLETKEIQLFNKNEITPEVLAAGSSLFFVANPQLIGNNWFAEGSYIDSINFQGILAQHSDIDNIVVMNILNKKALIRKPKNLYDAYNLSVILPFVTIARDDIKIFKLKYEKKYKAEALIVDFDLPENDFDYLDWSHDNFNKLKKIGYNAGKKFYNDNKHKLLD